jgi:hypothetical protein
MLEVAQRDQRLANNSMVASSGEIGDESHTTGVVLVVFVVQACVGFWYVAGHGWPPPKASARPVFIR